MKSTQVRLPVPVLNNGGINHHHMIGNGSLKLVNLPSSLDHQHF